MNEPKQDAVIVTGASKGIGLAIAQRLITDGHYVVAVSRSLTPELEAALNGAGVFFAADLSDTREIPGLVRQVKAGTQRTLVGLVNNAGVGLDGLLATQHEKDIAHLVNLNLIGPMTLTKYVSRDMIRARRGRIVNITSIVATTGFSGLAAYAATKAGLEGFTRAMARELGRVGVTVNAVAPGFVETDMTAGLEGDNLSSIKRRSPLGLAGPDDVAGAVAYLFSPSAAKTTGIVLTVDGGGTA